MHRRLFTILAAVSLLLCIAVVVLWVRSYWVADILLRGYSTRGVGVVTTSGDFGIEYVISKNGRSFGFPNGYLRRPPTPVQGYTTPKWSMMGFQYYYDASSAVTHRMVRIPLWSIAGAAASLSTILMVLRRRYPLHQSGLCPSCGYDLRATPERCPECGHVPRSMPAEGKV